MDDFAGPKPMPPVPDATASDPVALTDAERAAIRQTLVAEWRDDYSVLSLVNALAVTVAHIKAEAVEQERVIPESIPEVTGGNGLLDF